MKKMTTSFMILILVFVRADTRNAQSQCERNTEMSLTCYLFVSANNDFLFIVLKLLIVNVQLIDCQKTNNFQNVIFDIQVGKNI